MPSHEMCLETNITTKIIIVTDLTLVFYDMTTTYLIFNMPNCCYCMTSLPRKAQAQMDRSSCFYHFATDFYAESVTMKLQALKLFPVYLHIQHRILVNTFGQKNNFHPATFVFQQFFLYSENETNRFLPGLVKALLVMFAVAQWFSKLLNY